MSSVGFQDHQIHALEFQDYNDQGFNESLVNSITITWNIDYMRKLRETVTIDI